MVWVEDFPAGEGDSGEGEAADADAPAAVALPAWFSDPKLYDNDDEGVRLKEWRAFFGTSDAADAAFQKLDANADGLITAQELRDALAGTTEQRDAIRKANWDYAYYTGAIDENGTSPLFQIKGVLPPGATGISHKLWEQAFGDGAKSLALFKSLDATADHTITQDDIDALVKSGTRDALIPLWTVSLASGLNRPNSPQEDPDGPLKWRIWEQAFNYRSRLSFIEHLKNQRVSVTDARLLYDIDDEYRRLLDELVQQNEQIAIVTPVHPSRDVQNAWWLNRWLEPAELAVVWTTKNVRTREELHQVYIDANALITKINRRAYEVRVPVVNRFTEGVVWGVVKTAGGAGEVIANPGKVADALKVLATNPAARQKMLEEIEKKLSDDSAENVGELVVDVGAILSGAGTAVQVGGAAGKLVLKIPVKTANALRDMVKGGGKLTGKELDELLKVRPELWRETGLERYQAQLKNSPHERMANPGEAPKLPGAAREVPLPNLERPLGAGADGKVFEVLGNPEQVIKQFNMAKQVQNELDNLARAAKAEGFGPDNVIKVLERGPGYLIKEKVTPVVPTEAQLAEGVQFFKALDKAGVKDFCSNNVMFGTTPSNPTPRWIVIE